MKRRDLMKHLQRHGCIVYREGAKHTIVIHLATRQTSAVPRHTEINDFTAKAICRDLGVPVP